VCSSDLPKTPKPLSVICKFKAIQTCANELRSVSWSIASEVDG